MTGKKVLKFDWPVFLTKVKTRLCLSSPDAVLTVVVALVAGLSEHADVVNVLDVDARAARAVDDS